ncbi:hypothetical protein C8R45DRAFT_948077 [Mycena sanguinolenta]|nr:hypothetical protein C8R45DRAFT_948077 [Mycena sanguinolenta]
MPPRFSHDADQRIISFLAQKGFDWDTTDVDTFDELGPGVNFSSILTHSPLILVQSKEYPWSRQHKPDGWMRRAQQISDLDGQVMRLARLNKKESSNPSPSMAAASKRKTKGPVIKNERKGDSRSSSASPSLRAATSGPICRKKAPKRVETVEYDVERDLKLIAKTHGVSVELVREVFSKTGSVLNAVEWMEAFKSEETDRGDSDESDDDDEVEEVHESENEEEEEDEDEDEDEVATSSHKGPVQRRKHFHEDADDEAASTPPTKKRRAASAPPPAPKKPLKPLMFRARPRPASRAEPGPGLTKPGRARHRAFAGPGLGLGECQACQARQARAEIYLSNLLESIVKTPIRS